MSRLPLSDRGRLAQTCRALEASFCHPSLWNTVTIELYNPNIVTKPRRHTTAKSLPIVEPASYLPMVERFGAYFKDLTLVYVGSKYPMSRDCVEVIQCLTRCCRYDRLTLDVSAQVCGIVEGVEPKTTDMDILARLVTEAYYLKSFDLGAWPDYPIVSNIDMVEVLLSSERLKGSLERLSIFWHGVNTWISPNITVPTPDQMLAVTSRFTQLRYLYLWSSMLSDEIIVGLSGKLRTPLRGLGIVVGYTSRTPDGGLPHIEESSWTRLRSHSPRLQVHVYVMTRIPDDKLFGFLLPEIPVTSICFMHYSQTRCHDIRSLADRFSSTLRKFADLSIYSRGLDAELVYMVTKCSHLVHFEYSGTLRANTIRELAGLRGSRWVHFQVNLDHAITHDVDSDDDVIIKKGDDNSYYVVKIRQLAESTGDNRIMAIEQLTADVALLLK